MVWGEPSPQASGPGRGVLWGGCWPVKASEAGISRFPRSPRLADEKIKCSGKLVGKGWDPARTQSPGPHPFLDAFPPPRVGQGTEACLTVQTAFCGGDSGGLGKGKRCPRHKPLPVWAQEPVFLGGTTAWHCGCTSFMELKLPCFPNSNSTRIGGERERPSSILNQVPVSSFPPEYGQAPPS